MTFRLPGWRVRRIRRSRIEKVLAWSLLAGLVVLAGCEAMSEIVGPEPAEPVLAITAGPVIAQANGGGHFFDSWFTGTVWRFAFTALQRTTSGDATGSFHFRTSYEGLLVDVRARVTCMTVDAEHGRAWIGGIITQNRSEHPLFRADPDMPDMQVGQPTWFRVADNGEGANAEADRLTRNFFTGAGGFQTEWEFCTADPPFWPVVEGVQRFTDPVQNGNIQVRHR